MMISREDQPCSVCRRDLLPAGQTMRPEARHRSGSGARLSRISLKTTRAFTCGSRKDWRWVYSLPFLFRRETERSGLARNSRHPPLSFFSPTFSPSLRPLPRFFLPRAHGRNMPTYGLTLPIVGRLITPAFPRFYILNEIPAALCQFITFANQMMSLDILRWGLYCRLLCRFNTGFRETNSCRVFATHRLSR